MFGKSMALITRNLGSKLEVLMINHPADGYKLVGGTIEENESPEIACLREIREEAGLSNVVIHKKLLEQNCDVKKGEFYVSKDAILASRPDDIAFKWAKLPRGVRVELKEVRDNYAKVIFTEYENHKSDIITYQLFGWVKRDCLTQNCGRYTFHVLTSSESENKIEFINDGYQYNLEWLSVTEFIKCSSNSFWFERIYNADLRGIQDYLLSF